MLKILFADDSMTAQNMGKKILSDAGYEVIAVSNGAAAAKKLMEHAPDVAILDVHMPGYSGFEVCEKIRAVPAMAKMPVLLTVGKMEPYSVEEGARVKADGVIIKPFEASVLLATVRNLAERVIRPARSGDTQSFEATLRIETPVFQEFKDDSYHAWKSQSHDSSDDGKEAGSGFEATQTFAAGTAPATPPAPAVPSIASATAEYPAAAFAHTAASAAPEKSAAEARPAFDPFAETLPVVPSRHAAEPPAPVAAAQPQASAVPALPMFGVEEPEPLLPPVHAEEPPARAALADFEDTVPAWPSERQAAIQAAAQAAVSAPPAYPVFEDVAEYIDTVKIEPVRQPEKSAEADLPEELRDTQKIEPFVPTQETPAILETFEAFVPPARVEAPAGFEPTVLQHIDEPVITTEPALESTLETADLTDAPVASEPGLTGNAVEEFTTQAYEAGIFAETPEPEAIPASEEPASFSRPQDIAFEKMVADLLEREPVPVAPIYSGPNSIPAAAIPIPDQPSSTLSKYVALGRAELGRAEEEMSVASSTALPALERTQEFDTARMAAESETVVQEPVLSEAIPEELLQHPAETTDLPRESPAAEAGVLFWASGATATSSPGLPEPEPVYTPTVEYSYPAADSYMQPPETEETVEEFPQPEPPGPSPVVDHELAAQLAAALEHVAPAAHEAVHEPQSAYAAAAPVTSGHTLDADTVSTIVTKVLDRFIPEIVRVIAIELESRKHS